MVISPLTRRRLANFKANRLGFYSARIFLILLVISLFAEVLANDKPLFIWQQGRAFFPIAQTYQETDFGGDFAAPAVYHDPWLEAHLAKTATVIWPPIRYHHSTIDTALSQPAPSPPDANHWLGTDDRGRDIAAQLLYGFRLSVLFGLALAAASSIIGVMLGAWQGYRGGWVDLLMQRVIELWSGLPTLYILLIISSLLVLNLWWLLLVLTAFSWMNLVGNVRAEFLRARTLTFVQAARGLGVPSFKLMMRHILPNALVATIAALPFIVNGAIISLTSLDFLGFGLPAGYPSLGNLVAQSKANLQAPWLGFSVVVVLTVLLSLLVFIGEAVRDAFDSRVV